MPNWKRESKEGLRNLTAFLLCHFHLIGPTVVALGAIWSSTEGHAVSGRHCQPCGKVLLLTPLAR